MVHSCVAALALLPQLSASVSAYDPARAVQFAKFAGAAYCSQKSLEAWSCGEKCSADVSNVTVCNGAETKAFVGMWEGKCLVSFEGTSNVAAFIKDLEVLKKAVSWDGCEGCKVHGGFLDEYKSLEQCLKIVLAGTGCPTGSEIRTTGHSLGAAVNSIAMMDLSDAGWIIKESYDFGKPRVGDSNFAAAHNDLLTGKVWRVTHAKDPVPQVPPEQTAGIVDWHFEHVEPEIFYKGKVAGGFQKCTDAACKGRCAEQYWNVPLDLLFVGDHLDYMGQKTSPFGCRNGETNETVAAVAAATLPTKEIAPGIEFPVVNIGTWLAGHRKKEDAHEITKNWLAQGFRGIDTALVYNDQKDIAAAIEESGVPREEIFLTSKLPGCAAAAASVNSDLKQLNVDYIDLMLIHSPIGLSCPNTWKVLEDYVAQGKLRSIGVSNFNVKQLQQIMDMATVPIAVNQIDYNVFKHDEEIIAFCDANNITVEAYSPLSGASGAQSVFKDETVKAIADAHNVSAAQVALRWIVQRGHTLAVLSSSTEHQANDADLWSFELADDEMDTLTRLQWKAVVV